MNALLQFNDLDTGQVEVISIFRLPTHGSITGLDDTLSSSGLAMAPSHTVAYSPVIGFTGTDTFKIKIYDGTDSAIITIVATIFQPSTPIVLSPIQYCNNGPDSALVATGASLQWYTSATGGVGSSVTPIPSTALVGETKYYVSQTISGCESARDSIKVTIKPLPVISVTPSLDTICNGNSAVLTAVGGTSYSWNPVSGLNTSTGSSVVASPSATQLYLVTGSDTNNCSNTAISAITVNPRPADIQVYLTTAAVTCIGHQIHLLETSTGGIWSSGSPSIATIDPSTAYITGLDTGAAIISYIYPVTGCFVTRVVSVHPDSLHLGSFSTCYGNPITVRDSLNNDPWETYTGTHIGINHVSFTYSLGGGCEVDYQVITNSLPNPISSPPALCVGSSVTLTDIDSGGIWTCNSPSTATINATTGKLTGLASGTVTITYTLPTTCFTTITITINALPIISISPTFASVCVGSTRTLTASGGISYSWIPVTTLSSSTGVSVVASPTTTTTYTVTGNNINGCISTATKIVTVNSLPTVTMASPPTTICSGQNTTLTATGGTTYSWLPTTGLTTTTGTSVNAHPTVTTTYTVTGKDGNLCADTSVTTIVVDSLPTISITPAPAIICSGQNITLTASGGISYTWTPFTGLSASTGGVVVSNATATTIYTVTAVGGNGCANTTNRTVVVNPVPTVNAISSQVVCNNTSSVAITFTGSVAGATYSWTNSNSSIGLALSGAVNIPSFTALNSSSVAVTSTVTVTPFSNGCTGIPMSFTITVKPSPTVTPIPNQIICSGSTSTLISFNGVAVSGSPTTYNWINSNSAIGLGVSGSGDIGSYLATNATNVPLVSVVTVTPVANSCSGPQQIFSITVNPRPSLSVTSNQILCNGSMTSLTSFSGPVAGTTYSWASSDTTIGIASSGNGNIASFTSINSGVTVVTSTITVTPNANGCAGIQQSFTISVKPTPILSPVLNQSVCNHALTAPTTFTSSVVPVTYTWSNSNSSIGLATSGTGSIGSFTANNGSAVAVTSTITITPAANGCAGSSISFNYTVNPSPTVSPISNQTLCYNTFTSPIIFNGSVAGTTYNWANSNSSIGLASTGTGNIASFTGINSTSVTVTATITVTPVFNGCIGTSSNFTINVTPTPSINPVADQAICKNTGTSPINFSGSVPGASYTWTNSNAGIGLSANGTGNISSFTGLNSSSVAVTSNIIVAPSVGSCIGTLDSFTITINPAPTVNTTTNQILCNTSLSTPIIFGGSPIIGVPTTYNWVNSNNSIGIASTGSGDIGSFTAINTGTVAITSTVTVTPVANGCNGSSSSFNVTVKPTPTITSLSNLAVCNGAAVSISFSSVVSGTTYSWVNTNSSIGLATSGTGSIGSFIAVNSGSTITFSSITVTPTANGCIGSSQIFTITVAPTTTVSAVVNQAVCNNASTTPITFTGGVGGTVYNWSNSNSSIGLATTGTGDIGSFTAINNGSVAITTTITVTPVANSCTGAPQTFTLTVKPTPTVNHISDQIVCNNTLTSATFAGAVSGTLYSWTNSNSTIGITTTGTGNIGSFTAINTGTVSATAIVSVTPSANSCIGIADFFTITVKPSPTLLPIASQTLCNTQSSTPILFSGVAISGFSTTYNWINNNSSTGLPGSGAGDISTFTALNTGSTLIVSTVTVTPVADGCNGGTQIFTITAKPSPTIFPIAGQTTCNNASTSTIVFTGSPVTGFSTTYNWINSNASIGLATIGTGNIASFVSVNTTSTPVTSTITVTPYANGCSGLPQTVSVVVNPTPTVIPVTSQIVCNGTFDTAIALSGNVSGTVYNWSNSNSSIGLATTGSGDIASFIVINTGSVAVTSTITVTPVANTCVGTSQNLTITVKPAPTVLPISNQSVCNNNLTSSVIFNGTSVSGSSTIYNWINSDATIGLSSFGSDSIGAFTASNLTSSAIASTITVTPVGNGCIGGSQHFTITVKPTPTVLSVPGQTVCNNTNTATIVFNGTVSGTNYNWSNSNSSIGLASSGTGNIASFTGINSSSVAVTSTVIVTPVANSCVGSPQSFSLNVKPSPTVISVASQTICNSSTTTLVSFTGSPISGFSTVYNWTNSNNTTGIPATGSGDILPFVGSNSGNVANVSTITVTPVADLCSGSPVNFTITVNPTPDLLPLTSQSVCNGAATTAIIFSGGVTGTVYNWVNSNPSIGLPTAGTGNMAAFTGINTTTATSVSTVTVTPSVNGCIGAAQVFTISIKPTPDVNPVSNQIICNGASAATVLFGGSVVGTVYNWANNNGSIGLAASGIGNILSFPVVNVGTTSTISTITVTPFANSCNGPAQNFTITVNPTPIISPVSGQSICNGFSTTLVSFNSNVAGTSYSWANNAPSIGLASTGAGSIAPFSAINAGSTVVSAIITVTPTANLCNGSTTTFTIDVKPTPFVSPVSGQTICNGGATTSVVFGGSVSGASYSWVNSTSGMGLANSGTGNISSFVTNNTGTVAVTSTITVTLAANGCTGNSQNFNITVNPTPNVFSVPSQTVCNSDFVASTIFGGSVSGTVYNWINSDTSIGIVATGVGNIPAFTALNGGITAVIATINITPYANGCNGLSNSFNITVNPTPSVAAVSDQSVCNQLSTAAIIFGGSLVSGTTYNWSNSNNSIGLSSNGIGNIGSFSAINTSPVVATSTITVAPSANGCIGSPVSFVITVNPTPAVITGDTTVCFGLTSLLSDISVGGSWSTSNILVASISPVGLVSALSTGIDTITYTLPTGCLITTMLLVNPLPNAITGTDSVCVGANVGLANTTPGGIWSSANLSIATVSTSGLVFGVHSGIDTIVYTISSTGCQVVDLIKVNPLPVPIFGSPTACVNSPVVLTDSSGAVMYVVTPVTPGILTITLSNLSACSSHISVLVNPLPQPIIGSTGLCLGTTSQLTDSVSGGVWSSSDTSVATISSTGLVYARAVGSSTISYTLSSGCYRTATVTVNNLFIISGVQLIHPVTCNGISGAIKIMGVGSSITYNVNYLKNGIPHVTVKTSDAVGNLLLDSLTAGTYTNISVSLGGCTSNYVTGLLVDPPNPAIPHLTTNSPVCLGSILNLSSTDTTIGVSFVWSGPGGYTSTFQNTAIVPVSLSDSGYYKVTAGINNCFSSDSVMVHVLSIPNGSSITGSQLVCQFATTILLDSVSGGIWSVKNNHAAINSSGALTGISYGLDTAVYILSNICGSDTNSLEVFIDRIPVIDSITGPAYVCVGSTVTVADITPGGTWLMTNTDAVINTAGLVSGILPGTDTIQYVITNTCGSDTVHKSLAVIALPVAGNITGLPDVCIGSNILLSDTAIGGIWSSSNLSIATINSTGVLHGLSFGNVVIHYTVTNVCGVADVTDTVIVKQLPYAGSISGPSSICAGSSSILHSIVQGGSWSIVASSGVININTSGLGSDSVRVDGINAGTAIVRYVVSNTCGYDTAIFYVTVNPIPSLSSTLNPAGVCSGSPFNYLPTSASPGASYSWSRAVVPLIVNVAGYGVDSINETLVLNGALPTSVIYNVTVTSLGCSNTQAVSVIINPIPAMNSSLNITTCSDVPINYLASSATPLTSFIWSRASVLGILPSVGTGTNYISESLTNSTSAGIFVVYTFTLSAAGCTSTQNVNVLVETQAPAPPRITTMSPSYLCTGTMYQNFGAASIPPSGIKYTWTANGAEVWATGIDDQYCLVNFKYPGFTWVTLSSSYTGYTCKTRDSFVVLVGDYTSMSPEVIYHHPDFVCLFNPEWTYQWGYDDVGTLDSSLLVGETNQNYYNENPDFTNKYYWVITTYKDCMQKTYLRVPTIVNDITSGKVGKMEISPNPNNGRFNVKLTSDFTENGQLIVTDFLGRELLKREIKTNSTISVDLNETGVYILSIVTAHGQVADKIIVQL
ncbi:T9SS type A sorting domain-containing protein [Flavipsychrobacter stenotrophus]|uniref:T9SS type A sorting domain-containing protein n=1 Tax=Flavipsychrobacter stenotrophus TaxID=2077091 RepID=UPI0010572FA0|nr:T9SS type A sorting domain-containing protein [Flavipsychrobacter stenotrophus]